MWYKIFGILFTTFGLVSLWNGFMGENSVITRIREHGLHAYEIGNIIGLLIAFALVIVGIRWIHKRRVKPESKSIDES